MRIAFFILNIFDYDSRAQLICSDIIDQGWQLDIIATVGGKMTDFRGAVIHAIPQPSWPSRKRRFIEYNIRAARLGRQLNADIYHAVDLDTLWAAVKAAGGRARVLYESREYYTGLLALRHRPLTRAFWKLLESRLIHRADSVITVSAAIAEKLENTYNIERPTVVMNLARLNEHIEAIDLRKTCTLAAKYILVFQGVLRQGQGLFDCLDIVADLPEVGLVVIGDGPLRANLEKKVSDLKIDKRVCFVGTISPAELAAWTAGADAGFLLIEPVSENHKLAMPQKLFQYICAGVPPIVTDIPGLKQTVESDSLGLVLPKNKNEWSKRIWQFLQNELYKAKNSCLHSRSKYSWENESPKLIAIYERLGK